MTKKLLLFGVVALIVVVVSFPLGFFVASGGGQEATSSDSQLSIHLDQTGDRSRMQSHTFSDATIREIQNLKELESLSSHFQRTVALQKLLADADEETLLQYWKQSTTVGSGPWEEVQIAIAQRLATIDPLTAWELVSDVQPKRRLALVGAVFREWAVTNLELAIEHARGLDAETKNAAVVSMLLSREDLSIEQRREIARQLNTEALAIEAIERASNTQLILDPSTEWAEFLQHNTTSLASPNEAQIGMVTHIATAWIQQDGVNAFDNVLDSLPSQSAIWNTSNEVIRHLTDVDPQQAFDLAIHLRSRGTVGLAEQVVAAWTNDDPWSALNAVSSVDAKNLQRSLQARVLDIWSYRDPRALLDRAGAFPEYLQQLARKKALISLSRNSPQDAAEMIFEMEDQATRDEIALAIARNWSTFDITSVLHWIENEPGFDHNRDQLIGAAFSGLANSDPELALQTALAQPVNEEGLGPEAEVINSLTFADMDTAIKMLSDVREGKTKIKAYDRVIGMLTGINNDNDRAVGLLVQLTKEQEIPRDAWVLTGLVFNAPNGLFNALDRFDSMDFRRRVARELLRFHEHDDTFAAEQITVLKELEQYNRASREAQRLEAFERYFEVLRNEKKEDESESD